jgi:putative tricarboxylic transport membrane protein
MERRRFAATGFAALAAATLPAPRGARAGGLGTLKMLIPANPGGGWDQTSRVLGAAMQVAKAVQSVQFDHKGGAAGTIGLAQFVNASKGDPNVLMVGGMVMVGGIALNRSPVDLSMVTPVARLTTEYEVTVVPAASPHKTIGDRAKALRAEPGKVSWGGGSAGGTDHILVGLFAKAVGGDATKINYVPFMGGGEAIASIIGGHVAAGVSGLGEFAEQIRAGGTRALAGSGPKAIDGIASLKEQGIDVELGNWRGVFAAPGIAPAQRDVLIAAVKAGVDGQAWKDAFQRYGRDDAWLPGDEYRRFVDADVKRITGIIDSLGLRR